MAERKDMSNQHSPEERRVAALVARAWHGALRLARTAPLAGDASTRRYWRAWLERVADSAPPEASPGPAEVERRKARTAMPAPAAPGDSGEPPTVVVMLVSGSGLSVSSDELAVFEEPPKEMPFLEVQRYLASVGVAVPAVWAAEPDLVLLEDVGDRTLWDAVNAPGADPEGLYLEAIDALVALQRAGVEHPDPGGLAFRQRFDERLFSWELEHFLEYGFTGRDLPADDDAALRRELHELAADLASGPYALTHRDYHSWNLFVHQGRIRIIDFQDALLAPVPYDLATLLNDRATPRVVGPALERRLVRHFVERRNEALGESATVDGVFPRYDRYLLQKSLKIIGRFHYLETVKGKKGYVAMLPDTFSTLGRCLSRLPELAALGAILRRRFPEIDA